MGHGVSERPFLCCSARDRCSVRVRRGPLVTIFFVRSVWPGCHCDRWPLGGKPGAPHLRGAGPPREAGQGAAPRAPRAALVLRACNRAAPERHQGACRVSTAAYSAHIRAYKEAREVGRRASGGCGVLGSRRGLSVETPAQQFPARVPAQAQPKAFRCGLLLPLQAVICRSRGK